MTETSTPTQTETPANASGRPLLSIENLQVSFKTPDRDEVEAVKEISIRLAAGQTLGVVGESGSGKSVTAMSILRLIPTPPGVFKGGAIYFNGDNLLEVSERKLRGIRGRDVSMIFQEPMTSLNPVFTVGDQVAEAIIIHQNVSKQEAKKRVITLFDEVGIPDPERRFGSYPHQMSGGQKQRVMIAMALACDPKLLIADEPTTALDVTIQKQILELMLKLRDDRGMAIMFISHDLGVIAEISDYVAVMFRGELVEFGPVHEILTRPQHPYTQGLLACRPPLDVKVDRLRTVADFLEGGEELDARGLAKSCHVYSDEEIKARHKDVHARPVILEVQDLQVHFPIKKGFFSKTVGMVKAVDGISFQVHKGHTLGLVGESGCGKTTTGRAILRLVEPTGGKVEFEGQDFSHLKGGALRSARKRIQMIFQDPYSSLNPRMTIKQAVMEGMVIHNLYPNPRERVDKVAELLEKCGMPADAMKRFPHEFSGGQRQRIAIARSLAVEPEMIICDESVSALDVSVQAQILNLLKDLQDDLGLSYIFISHDLSVIKYMSDDIAVMYAGKIVEAGPAEEVYHHPKDPYTERLIESIPRITPEEIREKQAKRGLLE
ncbi:MAG: ABC transporter ATP-binding protein [Sumerlaeia bacterium]